ncbi:hypothetical protein V6N13_096988 [Hibiscus sabdariffa]
MRRIITLSTSKGPGQERTGYLEEPPWPRQEKLRSNGCKPTNLSISNGMSERSRDMGKLLTKTQDKTGSRSTL